MTNNIHPHTLSVPAEPQGISLDEALFKSYLSSMANLSSLPLDALDQFIEMLKDNFPTSLDDVSYL